MEEFDIATLTKRTISGVFALMSRTFLLNIISTVASLIIYTKLTPVEVGIYTAVIAVQRIISFFTDFGFGAALVQKKHDISEKDITTTFTIQAGLTFCVFLLTFLAAPYIISFLKLSSEANGLLLALVFTIFLSSFKTIPSILLERKIQFKKLVIPQIVESLSFNIILVVLLLRDFRIESYTWAFLISGIISIPFYYLVSPWKISIGIDTASLHHLKFGLQFQAKSVLAAIKDDFLTVILAKLLTLTELGYIGFAQRIAFLFYRYIVDSVTKVTFSAYARAQEQVAVLKTAVEKSIFYISLVMFPMLLGLCITAPYFIRFFPGWQNKWEPAIISLVFFCLNAAVSSISGVLVNVLDATGKVKVTLKLMTMWTVLTWILTPLFIALFGYNGVAIASFLVTATVVVTIREVNKLFPLSVLSLIYKPMIGTAVMCLVVYWLSQVLVRDVTTLIFVILIGVLVYGMSIFVLAKDELTTIKRFIRA